MVMRADELSSKRSSDERPSLITVPLVAAPGRVICQSSRPVAPCSEVTEAPRNTITFSSPDRERTESTANEPNGVRTGPGARRPVLHSAPPLDGSSAKTIPSLFIPTRSKVAGERRCAWIGCAISPTAARQPPRVKIGRATRVRDESPGGEAAAPGVGLARGVGFPTSITAGVENSPSVAVKGAIRQKYPPGERSLI